MSDLSLYSVNWQDGMLITQQHLRDQEKYFEQLARWHAFQGGDRYGLVKKSFSGKPALTLNVSVSGNRLRVEAVRCQALTADGTYIEINESNSTALRSETTIIDNVIPVFIGVDPVLKKQTGDADPAEEVPRLPYLINAYSIHLGQPPSIPEGRFLQVAQLLVSGREISFAPEYYPPCLTLSADEKLSQKAIDFRNRLENLLALSHRAYLAVTSAGALAGESTNLQVAFRDAVYLMVYHLAATLDDFTVGRNATHPLQMVILFKKLFRVFSSLMSLHPGLKDYLNEKFFTKELSSEIRRFDSAVENFIQADYNHEDLGGHIRAIEEILGVMRGIFGFLSETKREQLGPQAMATDTLTYGGRTYRVMPFSSTRMEQVGELSYLLIEIAQPRGAADTVVLMSKELCSGAEWASMQIRLGINDARGLGETDPLDIDVNTFGNKVALHPRDMLRSSSVRQVTLIFRGAKDSGKFTKLGKMDLIIYSM